MREGISRRAGAGGSCFRSTKLQTRHFFRLLSEFCYDSFFSGFPLRPLPPPPTKSAAAAVFPIASTSPIRPPRLRFPCHDAFPPLPSSLPIHESSRRPFSRAASQTSLFIEHSTCPSTLHFPFLFCTFLFLLCAKKSSEMTITPLGTAMPPKKCNKIKIIASLTASFADRVMDARDQENDGNSEPPGDPLQEPKVAVKAALGLPLPLKSQEPEKPKHRRDASSGIFLVSKKQRPSLAASRERGNVIARVNRAASEATAMTASAIVHEPAVNMDGGKPICKKSRRCKTAKHSDCKTTRQPFVRLSPELQCLGLTNVTPIVSKSLTSTDCNFNAHRLLLPRQSICDSPLMGMLTQEECKDVYTKNGVSLKLLDQHGRSYEMIFKFLNSDKQYRLIGEWPKFLKHNGARKGDLVDLGASRSEGRLLLTLLHHAMEEQPSEEAEAAEGTKKEWVPEKIEAAGGAREEQTDADMLEAKSVEEWTPEEMEAAMVLLALSHKDGSTCSNALKLLK